MKNLCKGLVLIGLLLMTFPVYSFEYTYEGNTLEYTELADGTVSVKKGSVAPQGALVIPEKAVDGDVSYTVTVIAENGFKDCSAIISVELPTTIKTIEAYGFRGCTSMTSIALNEGLNTIGHHAFTQDAALTVLTLSSTVTTIGDYVMSECPELVHVDVLAKTPPTVDGTNMFASSTAVSMVTIPCGTKSAYGAKSFWNTLSVLREMCDLTFDDGVLSYTVISDSEVQVNGYKSGAAMGGVLTIPATVSYNQHTFEVVEVRAGAFHDSEQTMGITSVVLPSTMKRLQNSAFQRCSKLTSVSLNEGLEYIGNRAFCQDSALVFIAIPSSVQTMGDFMFGYCISLETVLLQATTPPSLENKGADLLLRTPSNVTVFIPSGTSAAYRGTDWKGRVTETFDGGQLSYTPLSASEVQVNGYKSGAAMSGTLNIPAKITYNKHTYRVTEVRGGAFNDANHTMNIASLTLPFTMRTLQRSSFQNCSQLTDIALNEGLEVIGHQAFCLCTALEHISIPTSVKIIEDRSMALCSSLKVVDMLSAEPPALGGNEVFLRTASNMAIVVPCGATSVYATAFSAYAQYLQDGCVIDIYHHNYPNAVRTVWGSDAEKIYYHRIFTSGQWETLYLPFDVESVTLYDADDNQDYAITPWVRGTGGNFWLLKEAGTYDEEGYPEFVTTDKLESNTPYLIQFKDAYYDDKVVTFRSAENPAVETKFSVQRGSVAQMFGNNTMVRQNVECVYLLENNGQVFQHSSLSRTLYPFECYVTDGVGTTTQSRRFAIRYREAVPTDCGKVISGTEMLCTVRGNSLTIQTNGEAVSVYSVNGMLLQAFPAGTETATINLESGYYIVASEHGSQRVVL